MDLLDEAESRVVVTRYEAKNLKSGVVFQGNSVNVKSSISFDKGGDTKMTARLTFPPVSVGTLTVTSKAATVSSKYLGAEKSVKLPSVANEILQAALLGNLPPVYKYFGEKDFSNFGIYLDSDDTYELQREETGMKLRIGVNGVDKTLAYARVLYGKTDIVMEVSDYRRFDGKLLPSAVNLTVREGNGQPTKVEIEITDVTLQ